MCQSVSLEASGMTHTGPILVNMRGNLGKKRPICQSFERSPLWATEDRSRINSRRRPSMDNKPCCSYMDNNTLYDHVIMNELCLLAIIKLKIMQRKTLLLTLKVSNSGRHVSVAFHELHHTRLEQRGKYNMLQFCVWEELKTN